MGRPVYFACDMPGYAADLPSFVACAETFAKGIVRPAAIYGDVTTCTYAYEHGIRYLWQFGEGRAPGITVYQSRPIASTVTASTPTRPSPPTTASGLLRRSQPHPRRST